MRQSPALHLTRVTLLRDDREVEARLVNALNRLQAANEGARIALIDGNLRRVGEIAGRIGDLAATLAALAGDALEVEV